MSVFVHGDNFMTSALASVTPGFRALHSFLCVGLIRSVNLATLLRE